MKDQAEKLREKIHFAFSAQTDDQKKTRIITVTSGKGGVGKSNFSLNFALSLIKHNKKVMIFDVDLGLANIDVLMGVSPKYTMLQMVENDLNIWDIVETGPDGLQFVAGGSGFNHLFHLDEHKLTRFFEELGSIQGHVDYIILDTGAGLSNESLRFILAADDVVLVTTPEPTSITDAYAVLKMVHARDPKVDIQLVINRCTNNKEGDNTAKKLQLVTRQFLNKEVNYLGFLPDDPHVMKAVKKQRPFVMLFPNSMVTQAMIKISYSYLDIPPKTKGGLKGFLQKFMNRIG